MAKEYYEMCLDYFKCELWDENNKRWRLGGKSVVSKRANEQTANWFCLGLLMHTVSHVF